MLMLDPGTLDIRCVQSLLMALHRTDTITILYNASFYFFYLKRNLALIYLSYTSYPWLST
jgi:hypothetical protein